MKLTLITLLFVAVATTTTRAQDASRDTARAWTNEATVGVNFGQVGLSNWAGGGQNTITAVGLFNASARYRRGDVGWNNDLDLGYGMTKLEGVSFRKSDDRIVLTSKFGVSALPELSDDDPAKNLGLAYKGKGGGELSYTALLDLRTQFAVGRNYDSVDPVTGKSPIVSDFMAPGYLTLAAGLEYRPTGYFSLLFSPLAARAVIVLNDQLSSQGAYGVDPGSKMRVEPGMFLNSTFEKEVVKNISVQSQLNLFSSYRKLQSIAVIWGNVILMKVNDYVSVSLATDVIYDESIAIDRDNGTVGPATQFRDALSVGLRYGL
jgi:hypothetical protein